MEYLFISFIAGVLTILAPCVLPVLPIIIGGSIQGKSITRPLVITVSLALSIVLFTLLLQVFFANAIPQNALKWFSGGIILFFAFTLLFPEMWEKISTFFGFGGKSQELLAKSGKKKGILGMILIGASLGPVFASCSPTYFLILGTVLPQSFAVGLINLLVYAFGLALVLFGIAFFGQKFAVRLRSFADPKSWFKKILGFLFALVGVAIIMGWDKDFEAYILDNSETTFQLIEFEQSLIDKIQK